MAVRTGCGAAVNSESEYGQFLYTSAVHSLSCFSSGTGTIESEPLIVVPMYGYGNSRLAICLPSSFSFFSNSSLVYSGFGFDWFPLPTPTRMVLLSGVTATAVGYQPVGMKPLTMLSLGFSMSTTATQLLSALAT